MRFPKYSKEYFEAQGRKGGFARKVKRFIPKQKAREMQLKSAATRVANNLARKRKP